jgi:hypothetical protein
MSLNLFINSGVIPSQSSTLPSDLSGLYFWLDAEDSSTIIQSGGKISQWNDKTPSSSSYAFQVNVSQQPNVDTTSFPGKTVVTGVLPDGRMSVVPELQYNLGDLTMFLVATPAPSQSSYIFSDLNNQSGAPAIITKYDPGSGVKDFEFFSNPIRFTLATTATGLNLITLDSLSGNENYYFNKTLINSSSTNPFQGLDLDTILGPGGYAGSMAEFIIYNRKLSDSERNEINDYLYQKWNL